MTTIEEKPQDSMMPKLERQRRLLILKTRSIEILSLLMVLDAAKYDLYLDMLMKSIDEERPEPRKSQ